MPFTWQGLALSNTVYLNIESDVRKTYPNSCVLYVDELLNDILTSRYNGRKQAMINIRGVHNIQELRLFHGTKACNINSIAENGFLSRTNTRSAYGIGTYFSTAAGYSKDYTDTDNDDVSYMFVCDVLVGRCAVGCGNKILDTEAYDNFVNRSNDPTIYICPHDDACVPRYLVAFHKNAH